MDARTIWRVLEIEGLIPFTASALLIVFVVILREIGFGAAAWNLFVIAAVASFLGHIDAHPWNDIMDLKIDRREKSEETGRDRLLAFAIGNSEFGYVRCRATALTAGIATVIGSRIEQLRTRALDAVLPEFEARANRPMLQQVGASTVYVKAISTIRVASGVSA